MKSIILYLSIIILTTLLTYFSTISQDKKKSMIWSVCAIIIPSIFAALRYNIGTDYRIHEMVFLEVVQGLEVTKRAEFGYVLLNQCVASFGGSYNILLFFISFISISCVYLSFYSFKDKISVPIAMLFYMFLYYQMSFNFIRQLLAASIALYATVLFIKNKKVLSVVLCMIAGTFHVTALIYIPVLFVYSFLTNKKYDNLKIVIYVTLIICVFSYPIFLTPILEYLQEIIPQLRYFFNYLAVEYKSIGIGLFRYILLFIIPGLLFYKKTEKPFLFYFHISIIGFIMWLTSYVTKMEFYRISYTFLFVLPILLSYYWNNLEELFPCIKIKYTFHNDNINKLVSWIYLKRYLLLQLFFINLLIFFWYYDYFYLGAHETVPYISILGGL